jgi:hypothetical protein
MQERVIVRRAGLRGFKGQTRAALAHTLRISRTRVARLERRALRSLRKRIRAGGCATEAAIAPPPAATASEAAATQASAPPPPTGGAATGDRQAVKGASASGHGSVIGQVAEAAPKVIAAAPKAFAVAAAAGRSYADDHPLVFGAVMLLTLLAAALLVHELRRAT